MLPRLLLRPFWLRLEPIDHRIWRIHLQQTFLIIALSINGLIFKVSVKHVVVVFWDFLNLVVFEHLAAFRKSQLGSFRRSFHQDR